MSLKGVWKLGVHTKAEQAHVIGRSWAHLALAEFVGHQDRYGCAEEIISCRMTWSKLEFTFSLHQRPFGGIWLDCTEDVI